MSEIVCFLPPPLLSGYFIFLNLFFLFNFFYLFLSTHLCPYFFYPFFTSFPLIFFFKLRALSRMHLLLLHQQHLSENNSTIFLYSFLHTQLKNSRSPLQPLYFLSYYFQLLYYSIFQLYFLEEDLIS